MKSGTPSKNVLPVLMVALGASLVAVTVTVAVTGVLAAPSSSFRTIETVRFRTEGAFVTVRNVMLFSTAWAMAGVTPPLSPAACAGASYWNSQKPRGSLWASGEVRCASYNHFLLPNDPTYD